MFPKEHHCTEAPTQISDQCSFSVVASSSWSAWIFFSRRSQTNCGEKHGKTMGKLWENDGKTMLIVVDQEKRSGLGLATPVLDKSKTMMKRER